MVMVFGFMNVLKMQGRLRLLW